MSDTLTTEPNAEETATRAAIVELFVEIERKHEQIKRDREEFARSQTRTRELLASLKAA